MEGDHGQAVSQEPVSPEAVLVKQHFSKIDLDRSFNCVITGRLQHPRSNWPSRSSARRLDECV